MATARTPDPDAPDFEARLAALEASVRELEGEGLTLEESLTRYQEGVAHLKACRELLDAAEARLAELVPAEEGNGLAERPLQVGEDGLEDAPSEDA